MPSPSLPAGLPVCLARGARRGLAALALAGALAACSTQSSFTQTLDNYLPIITQFGVYRIDINQGNYLSQDMVDKLKEGQTKAQVRATLGTPLITSVFRDDRWDYVYQFQRGGRMREHRQFTVYFKDDLLARWEGDEMPQSAQELNRIAASRAMPTDPYGQDAGMMGKVLDFFKKVLDPAAAATR
ncbi:MAG: outer membrane protein assembly factor BamE [Burkholderiales bacterium]|nr:outer membrane protein assembly factor BamE [Burkholderiales bacterium]